MINIKQQYKVAEALKSIGIDIPIDQFCEETIDHSSLPPCIQSYESQTLKVFTGILKVMTEQEYENSRGVYDYDIELVNKIADAFFDSGDEELKKIAWNSFESCQSDDRFHKGKEISDASNDSYERFDETMNIYNHSPEFKTERLWVKPLYGTIANELGEYMSDAGEPNCSPWIYRVYSFGWRCERGILNFSIHLHDGTLVGIIGIYENDNMYDRYAYDVQYYIKVDQRGHGYASEALKGLIDQIEKNEIIVLDQPNYYGVYEEVRPDFNILRGSCDIDNYSSAKTLGKWMNEDGMTVRCFDDEDGKRILKKEKNFSYVIKRKESN